MSPLLLLALLAGCQGRSAAPTAPEIPADREEGLAPPPRFSFEEIAVLDGSFPHREPWSPHGQRLLLRTARGLEMFDAADPAAGLFPLTDFPVGYVYWSPDGEWILGLHRIDLSTDRLVCVPLDGSGAIEVYRGENCYPFLWAATGDLVYWADRDDETPQRIPPPAAWTAANPGPWPACVQVRLAPVRRERPWDPNLWACTYRVDADTVEIRRFEAPVPQAYFLYPRDEFPDGRTVLTWGSSLDLGGTFVAVQAPHAGASVRVIVPEWTSLGDGTFRISFTPESASADGRLLAGYSCVEDGHQIYASDLLIADVAGRWEAPLQGTADAIGGQFSREGDLIAWAGLHDRLVHVGQVRGGPSR
jgi:hypothetical protein